MNDQRLERALREGAPFQTQYTVDSLPLDQAAGISVARTRPMLLVLAVAALLLVGLVTALVIGALRPSASGLTCEEAASAVSTTTEGWRVESDPIAPDDARPGMLLTFDQESGGMALLDGGSGRLCTAVDGLAYFDPEDTAWSPTGEAVAMLSGPAGEHQYNDLAVISRAGVARYHLPPRPMSLAWAPDGRSIAVLVGSDASFNSPTSVWIVPADGSAPREMTFDCERCIDEDGPLGWAYNLAWSPSGERLAVSFTPAAERDEINRGDAEVLRMWAGSVESGRLTELTGIVDTQLLRWLDNERLFVLDRAGSPRWLAVPVDHPEAAAEAAVPRPMGGISPDSRLQVKTASDGSLLLVDLSNLDERVLLAAEPDGLLIPMTWAPDSRSIAFLQYEGTPTGRVLDGIWIITLDGDVRLLTEAQLRPGPWQPLGD